MKPISSKKPLWISHRGFCEKAVENTREAFQSAVDVGFTALETDLRITKDRHIVLAHDPTLSRLAGDRRNIFDLTRQDLERFRLSGGQKILFLDQFLSAFGGCSWTFDIKPEKGEQAIRALGEWAEKNGMKQQMIRQAKFLTWCAAHETMVHRMFPGAHFYARKSECLRAGISAFSGFPWLGGIRPGRTYALPPGIGQRPLFTKPIVDRYHRRNALVIAFLPPTEDQSRKAMDAGCDEILTNGKIIPG